MTTIPLGNLYSLSLFSSAVPSKRSAFSFPTSHFSFEENSKKKAKNSSDRKKEGNKMKLFPSPLGELKGENIFV
jgi:hypothetical protein